METNPRTSIMESWKSRIQTVDEAIQWFKQGLGSFNRDAIEDCIQTLEDLSQKVYGFRCTEMNQRRRRRIRKSETTNWCEKRSDGRHLAKNWQLLKHFQIPHQNIYRGASQARRRLPICETKKVRCLHCDGLTLTSRDSNVDCCNFCGCILSSPAHDP